MALVLRATLASSGRGNGCQGAGRGSRGQGQTGRGGGLVRVYALTRQDAQLSNVVITCIISVYSLEACALFDPRSTHSYVSLAFAKHFGASLTRLKSPF